MSAFGATPGPIPHELELIVDAVYGPWLVVPSAKTPFPAAVPATCEPWPLQSSGFESGCGTEFGSFALYASPTRSVPPLTRGAAGPTSVGSGASVEVARAAFQAAIVPGPSKFACV